MCIIQIGNVQFKWYGKNGNPAAPRSRRPGLRTPWFVIDVRVGIIFARVIMTILADQLVWSYFLQRGAAIMVQP
jgi:hypothetical protein